jgi:hypothetical protein
MLVPSNDDAMVTSGFMEKNLPNPVFQVSRSSLSRLRAVTKIPDIASVFHDLYCDTFALIVR